MISRPGFKQIISQWNQNHSAIVPRKSKSKNKKSDRIGTVEFLQDMSEDDLSDDEPENEDLDDQVENGDTGDQKSSDDSIVWNLGQVRKG